MPDPLGMHVIRYVAAEDRIPVSLEMIRVWTLIHTILLQRYYSDTMKRSHKCFALLLHKSICTRHSSSCHGFRLIQGTHSRSVLTLISSEIRAWRHLIQSVVSPVIK